MAVCFWDAFFFLGLIWGTFPYACASCLIFSPLYFEPLFNFEFSKDYCKSCCDFLFWTTLCKTGAKNNLSGWLFGSLLTTKVASDARLVISIGLACFFFSNRLASFLLARNSSALRLWISYFSSKTYCWISCSSMRLLFSFSFRLKIFFFK